MSAIETRSWWGASLGKSLSEWVRLRPYTTTSLAILGVFVFAAALFFGAPLLGLAGESKVMSGHGSMKHGEMSHGDMKHEGMQHGEMKHGEMGMQPTEGMHRGNPEEGKPIYQRLCASCHGASGKGDGPVGQALNPRPSDFTEHMQHHGDDHFFKVIKEGGASVGKSAAMPAWGAQLKEEEIWDVISYLRTFTEHH
jgi:mono/diheme cytochrome c family protein